MIVIKIFFASPRSKEWYLDVLPDVPLTVFRMADTLFQKLVQHTCHVRKLPPRSNQRMPIGVRHIESG